MLDLSLASQITNTMREWDQGAERVRQLLGDADASQPTFANALSTRDGGSNERSTRISVSGPGFLAVRTRDGIGYARSADLRFSENGTLIDQLGNPVMVSGNEKGDQPQALRLGRAQLSSHANTFDVDADGKIELQRSGDGVGTQSLQHRVLGRLCLATFPAPAALARTTDGLLSATAAAGRPHFIAAGSANAGTIRRGSAEFDSNAIQQELHRLWLLSGRAALVMALVASADGCDRIALSLVK